MGTRALISKDEVAFIATHWDGYPESLGRDLMNARTDKEIISIAKQHNIDFAHKSVVEELNEVRVRHIMNKHHLSYEEVKQGTRRGTLLRVDDWEISDIADYGDWPKYQYDLRNDEWFFRELHGEYPKCLEGAGEWKKLADFPFKQETEETKNQQDAGDAIA